MKIFLAVFSIIPQFKIFKINGTKEKLEHTSKYTNKYLNILINTCQNLWHETKTALQRKCTDLYACTKKEINQFGLYS